MTTSTAPSASSRTGSPSPRSSRPPTRSPWPCCTARARLEDVLGELARANAELEVRATALEELQAQLREQADRDALTGLHNRRYLEGGFARLEREPTTGPVSVAVLDLDHFKTINDTFGHAAGDQVLVRVAVLLRAVVRTTDTVVRTTDTVARTGGEEFVLLMPGSGAEAAVAVCERLLVALRAEQWTRIAGGLAVTASAGVASASADRAGPAEAQALVKLADQRLYTAKRDGRDRVRGETTAIVRGT